MKDLNNKGFGVISILLFLIAIGIMTAMVVPVISQNMTNNQVTSMETTVTKLQTDVQSYMGNGGSFTHLGIGNETAPSTINGLQSVDYKYLVPVSWTPNTVLNASYSGLSAQNGWYNIPDSSFATAYLVTAGNNVFTGSNPPEFALGLYAPQMTNSQANTVINYLQSKEPSGSFDEFIWNGVMYTWNSTNKNWENSSNQTIPLNSLTGNGQLIFGFNGYLQTTAATGGLTYTQPDPAIFNNPGQYQFTVPESHITITVAGAAGGYGGAGGGGGASSVWNNGTQLICAGGGGGGGGGYNFGEDGTGSGGNGGDGNGSNGGNGRNGNGVNGNGGTGGGNFGGGGGGGGGNVDGGGGGGGGCLSAGTNAYDFGDGNGGNGGNGGGQIGVIGLNNQISSSETITGSNDGNDTSLSVNRTYTNNGWVEISW
jgi:hypothetical protein